MDHRTTCRRIFPGLAILLAVPAFAGRAAAHVRYVTPGGDPLAVAEFLRNALMNPFNLAALAAGGIAGVAVTVVYLRIGPFRRDLAVFRETMAEYRDLLPWLLRLSVGLPLVGAGFSGYFFSPAVTLASPTFVRLFGITVGFLLLFGFGTRLMAFVGLVGYLVGLSFRPTLLLAFEYVPALAAIALLGGGRPSADHVVARLAAADTVYSRIDPFYRKVAVPFVERVDPYRMLVPVIVRIGLGLSFIYLGITQKLMNPGNATAVVAKYNLTAVVPVSPELWVVGAGVTEAAVGTVLLVGAFTRAASAVAFLLFTSTLFGLPDDPVLAHISLFGLASALLVTGAGRWSVDAWLSDRTDSAAEWVDRVSERAA
jgi:uncharacterized membrane protein YphA (DoxX/SURF4 family)